ncbi:MAG: sugar kinase [Planctomycetes bacterium]|nr:sugar kinase [Planctomycetota bacterium]
MTISPNAFSPASITCFFVPMRGDRPETTVSRGCAITLADGVTAGCDAARTTELVLNGETIAMPPLRRVVDALAPEPVRMEMEARIPLGCGFGVSAGCVLAGALALDARFDLGRSRAELGMMAHVAEVQERTGIGDVAAQLVGGVVWRRGDGGPFDCVRLDVPETEVSWHASRALSTASVLDSEDRVRALEQSGRDALAWLRANAKRTSVGEILDRSHAFVEDSGLLTDAGVRRRIVDTRNAGGHASMALLGHTVIATSPAAGDGWTSCPIDRDGARTLP